MEDPPAFHLFYATGWRDAVLRVRTLDADGTPQMPVCTQPMRVSHNRFAEEVEAGPDVEEGPQALQ